MVQVVQTAVGAGSAVPVLPLRPPVERPRSAPPKERPRVTVPVPFSFAHREKKTSVAERRMHQELAQQKMAFEAEKENSAKARPLPPTTAPGLYSEMVAEAAAASKERRQQRRTIPVPFSFSNRGTKAPRKSDAEAMAEGAAAEELEAAAGWVAKGEAADPAPAFKAREVPRSMAEPRWEMMQVKAAERKERAAYEAMKSLQRSKLPPRMQQHKDNERLRKAAEQERIQQEADAELTLQPRITKDIPDFDALHTNFERSLARKRNEYTPTQPVPFRMESEPYKMMQREVQQVKSEMIARDIRRDELVMPEKRWPYLSTQAPVGRKPIPDFKKQHAEWGAKHIVVDSTAKLDAHREKLRRDEEKRQKAKEAEDAAEKARKEQHKRATKAVSAAIARAIGGDPKEVKEQTERELKARREEHRQSWAARKKELAKQHEEMRQRIDARPFMFEQASVDVAVERAKAAAHERFDATLKKHGLASKLDP